MARDWSKELDPRALAWHESVGETVDADGVIRDADGNVVGGYGERTGLAIELTGNQPTSAGTLTATLPAWTLAGELPKAKRSRWRFWKR
jgi:hypothetical protein